jgi:purine-binding chemotaxis protein CheW
MGASVDTSFILGMGKVGDAVKILLDIDKVMTDDEIASVSECAKSAALAS